MTSPTLTHHRRHFGADFLASIVVFLVALPLCMGIAVASGVPPALGLVTGILGGIVVGFLAGSPLQVSGPAAGLTVLVWDVVQRFGVVGLGPVVLIAGGLQILAGVLRFGRWFRAVPPSVIYGMLAGIGIIIVVGQFHVMLDDAPRGNPLANLIGIPQAIWKGVFPLDGSVHHMAAAIGIITIGAILLWNAFAPRRVKVLPGALVGVSLATVIAHVFDMPIARVAVPDDLLASVWPPSSKFGMLLDPAVLGAGLGMAVIASAETLLCATAVDRMHSGPRTQYNRELVAQGVGNALCGVLGALPMTGVIVRSSANVQSGGKTRASAILHGVWLLALVVAAPGLLRLVPVSSLAAVLVFTGWKLINPAAIRSLRAYGRSEVAVYVATIVAIVATDLLKGILVGIALAVIKLVYRFVHLRITVDHNADVRNTEIHVKGSATFLRLPELTAALESVPPTHDVEVHLDELDYIDHACLETLMDWDKEHSKRGGRVAIRWDKLRFLAQGPIEEVRQQRHRQKSPTAPGDEAAVAATPHPEERPLS